MNELNSVTNFVDLFDEWVVDEAAKTYTRDAVSAGTGAESPIYPQNRINTLLDNMFRKDDKVSASITTKVDGIMSAGVNIHGTNKRNIATAKRLITMPLLRQTVANACLYGNAFWEVERTESNGFAAFHVIETPTIYPVDLQGHGEVDYYIQELVEKVVIPAENIYHWRMDRMSTTQWAEVPVQPIAQYVALKLYIKNHVTNLFKNNSFRPVLYVEKGISKDDLNSIISFLKEAKKDPDKPLVNFGDGRHEALMKFDDGSEFREWINLCDAAILTQMQVPPIMAGLPDNSGRASGEQATYKAFNTHLKGIISNLEEQFKEFFEQIGLSGVEITFGSLDQKSEKDYIDMALKLKSMGAKSKKLVAWMNKQGLDLDDDFFDDDFFMSPSKTDANQMTNADPTGSREPKAEGEMNKRVGTASEGTTRQDQIDEAVAKYQILDQRIIDAAKRLNS